ncbi:hypothetical protein JCM14635_20550 [Megalodesulfovibrio paquesii]
MCALIGGLGHGTLPLTHRGRTARHQEELFARRMNFWRDIQLPPVLAQGLMSLQAGDVLRLAFAAGEAVPDAAPACRMRLPARQSVRFEVLESLTDRGGQATRRQLFPPVTGKRPALRGLGTKAIGTEKQKKGRGCVPFW